MHAPRLHVGAPASLPALQFLGAEKSLAGYRSALNARLAHWRPERSVRLNLEAVLDLKFPSPQEVRAGLTHHEHASELPSLQDALRPRASATMVPLPTCHPCRRAATARRSTRWTWS